jgi:hypothetical protein
MEAKVILRYKGSLDDFSSDNLTKIEAAIANSVCRLLRKEETEPGKLKLVVSVCSDKLPKLYDELLATSIQFEQDYSSATDNASKQYSVFREMELELELEAAIENELKKSSSLMGFMPFVAL